MPKLSLEHPCSQHELSELDFLKLDLKSLFSWFSALQEMTRVFEAKELEEHLNLPITPELILAADRSYLYGCEHCLSNDCLCNDEELAFSGNV